MTGGDWLGSLRFAAQEPCLMLAPVNDWVAPVMTPFVGLKEPKESKESKEKEPVKEKEAGLLWKNHCMEELGKFWKNWMP